ncbi:MAG: hypothetical protein A2288_03650 [Candidatus Moranbacteria bacterium RIFOXYA12_FULL_44_15]|nr:MAG: hypothetical protein A2288_03650 [Candidatus Moranbacteria bacterium RIFOXYA12_FULL_44_15]
MGCFFNNIGGLGWRKREEDSSRGFQEEPVFTGQILGSFFEITGISPGEIRFMACGGGQAKCKALPKLQSVLAREVGKDCGNPRVKAFLKRVGPGDNGAPSYVLRKWYSNCGKIMSTKSSSRVFRVKDSNNNGHGGNGHH